MTLQEREELQTLSDRFANRGPDEPMATAEIDRLVILQQYAACEERFVIGSHWRLNLTDAPAMLVSNVSRDYVGLYTPTEHRFLSHKQALVCLVPADVEKPIEAGDEPANPYRFSEDFRREFVALCTAVRSDDRAAATDAVKGLVDAGSRLTGRMMDDLTSLGAELEW